MGTHKWSEIKAKFQAARLEGLDAAVEEEKRRMLKEAFEALDKVPSIIREEGDYWEEDENGVMFLRRKSGAPVLMMSKADYEEMLAWRENQR